MHMPFEATITLSPETYQRVVIETCVSTAAHGAKKLLIVNWHEGNIASLQIAAEALHRTHGMSVVIAQACYVAEELWGPSCNGLTHAGEIEALAILPDHGHLVHLDRVERASEKRQGAQMDKLRRTRAYVPVLTDIRSIAPTGWYGDPAPATAEPSARRAVCAPDAGVYLRGKVYTPSRRYTHPPRGTVLGFGRPFGRRR